MRVWCGLMLAGILAAASAPCAAQEDDETVDCSELEKINVPDRDSYDEYICMAGSHGGLSSGERRGPVGGPFEAIVAYNRATFALVRFAGTNNHTYLKARHLEEALSGMLSALEPRSFGIEQLHDRFKFARLQAKVSDDSPFLNCVGFLRYQRPAPGSSGYREVIAGLYCAMDMEIPTDEEIATFLDKVAS